KRSTIISIVCPPAMSSYISGHTNNLKPAILRRKGWKKKKKRWRNCRQQSMMRSRNRYDFDDMINWVIKAFEEDKNLLNRYQEQYQYILVDEYQDTSGTQNRLVQLLISYWDRPNVFVVGDDDQCIYRFQGAN